VVEREAEVLAGVLLVGVALGDGGEVLQEDELAGLHTSVVSRF